MKLTSLIASLALVAGLATPANAEPPAERSAISFWGGYVHTFAQDVHGFYFVPPGQESFNPDPSEGWFFGASASTPLTPFNTPFSTAEVYFESQLIEHDGRSSLNVNNGAFAIAGAAGPIGANALVSAASASLDRERHEFGVNLVRAAGANGALPAALTLTPFGGFGREDFKASSRRIAGGRARYCPDRLRP